MTLGKLAGKIPLVVIVSLAVVGCIVPRLVQDAESSYLLYVLFQAFLFLTLAQGWNLVAGFAGQISLGQHAFFGSGAYVTALIWNSGIGGYFDPLTMLLSGFSAALLAYSSVFRCFRGSGGIISRWALSDWARSSGSSSSKVGRSRAGPRGSSCRQADTLQ
jgi:ABC-type branched-subunit amino acid transport system permease subunit